VQDAFQPFRLGGRTAIVTGASSGLGVGFARVLASVGARVVVTARRAVELERVADELRADGHDVLTVVADVADPDACQAVVHRAMEWAGRVDVLVNNAGIASAAPATRITREEFRRVIDINLNGTFWMAQSCARVMTPGSSIVNVSSVLGLRAPRFPNAPYSASKAGVIGLTRDLAQQWSARKGIRVNALCPGYIATDILGEGEQQITDSMKTDSMLGRLGQQHEVWPALLFLASDASSYVTGATLSVDGGMGAL
jgi:NAD(P)-dependent dehydrogenase (short-subunit alcohol dehydrogenase family)